jgi:hypothetical protein
LDEELRTIGKRRHGKDEERFSTERRQGLGLMEDRRQLGELIAIGPQLRGGN